MNLTEVLVSATIFAIPLPSILQIENMHRVVEEVRMSNQEMLNAVDKDRLTLQGAWMQIEPTTCLAYHSVIPMMTAANQIPAPSKIQRQIFYLKDGVINTRTAEGQSLMVNWKTSDGKLLRQRIYTPMGMGICW
jgi:hypothetical protein